MSELPVNEVFETIQGEATFTGMPAVFVRLQGCDVGCPWCDTKHTWSLAEANRVSASEMSHKQSDAPTYAVLAENELLELLETSWSRHVVITGGEPCEWDLTDLTAAIIDSGSTVQIETSGTREVRADSRAWVTLSPKIDMPGGLPVLDSAMARADELKMPVGKPADIVRLRDLLAKHPAFIGSVWLQPLSQNERATELCVTAATENGWRISIQTHKFIGVR